MGAGGFAQGMHLPNLVQLRADFEIHCIMSRTGTNAKAIATQYEAAYCTTDYQAVLNDSDVDLVLIATRHNLHASYALAALEAGKNVLVEKPLALNSLELRGLEDFFRSKPEAPVLMTGFNRRFSPAIQKAKQVMNNRSTPLIVNYRMNAGYIPPDHWVHGAEGGGRNIGEACHIYDLFTYLTGSSYSGVRGSSIGPTSKQWRHNDNFVAVVEYTDGSVCTLTYTALGNKSFAKEQMEIFADGKVISLDDFKTLSVNGSTKPTWRSGTPQKGQFEELQALAECLKRGGTWPISLRDQIDATQISFEVENQISPREMGKESVD